MSSSVPIDRFNAFINEIMVFLSIARDSEMQKDACRRLRLFSEEIAAMKMAAAFENAEDTANLLLGFECVAFCLRCEIAMWLFLKMERPESAWNCLVSAQNASSAAARAHRGFKHLIQHSARLEAIEELVFPPQIFTSSGLIAQRQICSVCGHEYGECDHLAGMPYMGEFCSIIAEGLAVDHVALVDSPADKRCRITNFSTDGGRRNRMTWKLERSSEESKDELRSDALRSEAIIAVSSGIDPSAEFC